MTVAGLALVAGLAALIAGLAVVGLGSMLGGSVAVAGVAVGAVAAALSAGIAGRALLRPLCQMTEALASGRSDATQAVLASSGRVPGEIAILAAAVRGTERRLQKTVLQSQRDRAQMATIFEHMADGILVLDANDRIELCNPGATRLLRHMRIEGMSLAEAVRDADLVEVVRAVRIGSPVTQLVELRPEPGGARAWVHIVATRVPSEPRTIVLLQDITQLRHAEAARRDFVANVSHELRTPVASLKALVETLEAGAITDADEGPEFLRRMHVEVDGLAQLVSELLELARIEAGRLSLDLRPCRMDELAHDAAERMRPYASRVGLELALSIDSADDLWVNADPWRVGQVLSNLLSNAVKFTPPGGRISIGARLSGDQVEAWVSDTGAGIAPDQLVRVFERFYKIDVSRTSSGTGLGLAICKHLVLAHRGTIRAESDGPGRGATFVFSLPAAEPLAGDECSGNGLLSSVRVTDGFPHAPSVIGPTPS